MSHFGTSPLAIHHSPDVLNFKFQLCAMQTVIITGVSGNLGQAVAKRFLAENFKVIGTVIPNDPVHLDISDPNFETVVVDLMNEEDSEKFVRSVVEKNKTIDV